MKQCRKCNQTKPLNEFRNDKYTKDGKTTRCAECLKRNNDYPKHKRCPVCGTWFIAKQSNYKFCKPKCHTNYWSKIRRVSVKGNLYMLGYQRQYSRSNGEECMDCGKIVSNGSKRCERCHCKMMSKLAQCSFNSNR